jgi:hypothetical protein
VLRWRVDEEKREQADRQREHEVETPLAKPTDQRVPQQPDGDRDDADIHTDQRERTESRRRRRRCGDGHRNRVIEREPRAGHQPDRVLLPVDPRVGDRDRRPTQVRERRAWLRTKRPERIVHDDLRDGDGVWTVVQRGDDDPSGPSVTRSMASFSTGGRFVRAPRRLVHSVRST